MHLSIGLHTSERKSYPQPLQPAKHRGIAPDINQRLRTDRPNYLSKARSGGSFFTPQRGKISTCRRWKTQSLFTSPSSPQEATYIGSEIPAIFSAKQQTIPQHHSHHLHRSKKATATGQQANQYYSPYRTSTAHTSDQYWPHNRYRSTRAELYRMAKKTI